MLATRGTYPQNRGISFDERASVRYSVLMKVIDLLGASQHGGRTTGLRLSRPDDMDN